MSVRTREKQEKVLEADEVGEGEAGDTDCGPAVATVLDVTPGGFLPDPDSGSKETRRLFPAHTGPRRNPQLLCPSDFV